MVLTINLSILDFKFCYFDCKTADCLAINLSILDFKYFFCSAFDSFEKTINLSILDFKAEHIDILTFNRIDYKSIHIGF